MNINSASGTKDIRLALADLEAAAAAAHDASMRLVDLALIHRRDLVQSSTLVRETAALLVHTSQQFRRDAEASHANAHKAPDR